MTEERKLGDLFTVDITPTWAGLMPAFIHILEKGEDDGRVIVREELMKMARTLDEAAKKLKVKEDDDGEAKD